MATLFDKIWKSHLAEANPAGPDLLYIDRHLVHEVTSPQAFSGLAAAGRKVRRTDLTFAVMDHVTPTDVDRTRPLEDKVAEAQLAALDTNCREFGVPLMDMDHPNQGVIHVTMPELGLVLPGNTVVAGDSHTSTHGAFGALAFGIGTSEVEHVLATQTLPQKKFATMLVRVTGVLPSGVTAKDLALTIINRLGAAGGRGRSIEFAGEAVAALSMEGRMTLCNMSVECGAKSGIVAPDQVTFDYLKGRAYAPAGADWDQAVAYWQTLKSDSEADFGKVLVMGAESLAPMVTWGTSPDQSVAVNGVAPDPAKLPKDLRAGTEKALAYTGIAPGARMDEQQVDWVFIGSCTNGRIEDLRAAAAILKGKKVASHVTALVVPGSGLVKAEAEAEGLDKIFKDAGFDWRLPGCSMCLGMNPDLVPAGKRSASTSNRNFEGRQGRLARTHLVSPSTAAATAIAGKFADPRDYIGG